MRGTWLAAVRGYVGVKLIGGRPADFLNAASAARVSLWNIAYTPAQELTFATTVPDFFRLRPLLRQSRARTRIVQKRGLPFQTARLARRKTFAAGMLIFLILLFVLSTFVWQVKVEGESAIPEENILLAAKQEGLYRFQWGLSLPDSARLASRLASRLTDAAWVGVERKGTTVTITVVDSTKPEARKAEGPQNLISNADAVITRIIAENGKPQVERNDRVRKGQILVSGWLGDGIYRKAVVSKGKVMGLVWHEMKIASPLLREQKLYTGAVKERTYWLIGNRALQISGYGGEAYAESRTGATVRPWHLFGWKLPLGIMNEKELEVVTARERLTAGQAREAGIRQARAELLARCGEGARITAENILHEHMESGKVLLTVLFEVEQSIAAPQPIVQAPGG